MQSVNLPKKTKRCYLAKCHVFPVHSTAENRIWFLTCDSEAFAEKVQLFIFYFPQNLSNTWDFDIQKYQEITFLDSYLQGGCHSCQLLKDAGKCWPVVKSCSQSRGQSVGKYCRNENGEKKHRKQNCMLFL